MRTLDDICKEWDECNKGGTLTITDTTGREWIISNSDWRKKLEEEYNNTLPKYESLAIAMHSKFCKCNHIDQCSFYMEVDGIKHNFGGSEHMYWLNKAHKYADAFTEDMSVDQIMKVLSATP